MARRTRRTLPAIVGPNERRESCSANPQLASAGVPLLALGAAAPAHAASGGLCQLQGTASFTPGLNNTAQNFSYSFSGSLSGCQSTDQTSPASGTVSAGQVVTGAGGEQFQEPVPTGNGTCANGTTSGVAIASWADGTQTVVSYSTTAAAAAVKALF